MGAAHTYAHNAHKTVSVASRAVWRMDLGRVVNKMDRMWNILGVLLAFAAAICSVVALGAPNWMSFTGEKGHVTLGLWAGCQGSMCVPYMGGNPMGECLFFANF